MMSPQDWVWEAFSLYDSLFSYMHPFILRMDTKSRSIYVEPSKWNRYIWCLSILIKVVIVLMGSSLYVLVKWHFKPQSVNVEQGATAVAMLLLGILVSYTCFAHYIYREEHVLGVNNLLQLHSVKIGTTNKKRKKTPKGEKPGERDLKQMVLGLTMKSMVWGFWCVPLAVLPIAIFEGIDPFKVILVDMTPLEWLDKYPVHVLLAIFFVRFLIVAVVGMEVSRFLAMFFLLFISGIVIYIDYIDRFVVQNAKSGVAITSACFEDFHYARILVQILTPILRREICCLMFTGFGIAVGSAVSVLQGWEIFPWYMYYAFWFSLIITITIIYCTLPFGTDSYEKTALALEKWRTRLPGSTGYQRKLIRKILQSLKPVSVRCGPFFKLERETKATYFEAILSTSCDLNISVDIKAMFEHGM